MFPSTSLQAAEQTDALWSSLPPCPSAGKLQQQELVLQSLQQSRAGLCGAMIFGEGTPSSSIGVVSPLFRLAAKLFSDSLHGNRIQGWTLEKSWL